MLIDGLKTPLRRALPCRFACQSIQNPANPRLDQEIVGVHGQHIRLFAVHNLVVNPLRGLDLNGADTLGICPGKHRVASNQPLGFRGAEPSPLAGNFDDRSG